MMLDIITKIDEVRCALIFLITMAALHYTLSILTKYWNRSSTTKIPGPPVKDANHGNLPDIAAAGSYFNFLKLLHENYGPVARFYMGPQQIVSLASPELFKITSHAFDRPHAMFEIFSPLMAKDSLAFANGDEGKQRRKMYDAVYSHSHMRHYFDGLQNTVEELLDQWTKLDDNARQNIPLSDYTYKASMKSILRECFGSYFNNDKLIEQLREFFDYCWHELEQRAGGVMPEPGSERDIEFTKRRDCIYSVFRELLARRRDGKDFDGRRLFIDVCIEYGGDNDVLIESDLVDFVIGGYMSTGELMTWVLYNVASNADVQEKILEELDDKLGDEPVTFENYSQLKYMKQVIDEALRTSLLGTFLIRELEYDVILPPLMYEIPAKIPIVQAIAVVHMDEKYWPDPQKFDPSHFDEDKVHKRPRHSFVPFGFGGGRMCPGFRFTYVQVTVFLSTLLRKYSVRLANGQGVPERFHGLLTATKGQIYISLNQQHGIKK